LAAVIRNLEAGVVFGVDMFRIQPSRWACFKAPSLPPEFQIIDEGMCLFNAIDHRDFQDSQKFERITVNQFRNGDGAQINASGNPAKWVPTSPAVNQ
jgi:hypothetical protein